MASSLLRRPLTYRYYNATMAIIGLNVLVYLVNYLAPDTRFLLALSPAAVVGDGAYWQLFTYMFVHAPAITHILFNMLGLFFFGFQVERRMGSTEFVIFYLVTGLGAGIFSFVMYVLTGTYDVVLLGASGAIFGVLLAYASFFPEARIYLLGLIPFRAPTLVLVYVLIELFSEIFSFNGGAAHLTHLAGFGVAYLYLVARLGEHPIRSMIGDRFQRR